MALRRLAKQFSVLTGPSGPRLLSTAPTVFDKMVQFFVIDTTGVRHTVRGLEGQTLAEAMQVNWPTELPMICLGQGAMLLFW